MNQEWKKRLKEVREARGLNKTAFAKEVGVSNATITDWEKSVEDGGIQEITGSKLVKVCQVLGINAQWLLDEIDAQADTDVKKGLTSRRPKEKIPLISWVVAGAFCDSPNNFHPDAEDWFDCPVPHSSSTYCLKVAGDSMDGEGGYRDGEIIFVDPKVPPTPGKDIVGRTPDGKTIFKRLKQDTEGLYLLGLNGKKIIRVPEGTHFCGVVIFSGFKR